MKMLFCDVCNRKITIGEAEEFEYTVHGGGPYCEVCWFFIERIEALEKKVSRCCKEPPIRTRPSPYDAGVRRG